MIHPFPEPALQQVENAWAGTITVDQGARGLTIMIFLILLLLLCVGLALVALARTSSLEGKVKSQELRIDKLSRSLDLLTPSLDPVSAPPTAPREAMPRVPETPSRVGHTTVTTLAKPAAREEPRTSRTKEEWEALIGGKLLNRVGALALIIGVSLFLKYASDRDWIPEWLRVVTGGGVGVALLMFAARSARRGYQVFSQGLVGAGIAILYLSAYATFNYYHLVSQPVAFALMSAVTLVAFAEAFRNRSLAVALLGWLGGFMTPFLLSTGENNEIGLFTYIALLDVGLILVVLRMDAWFILEPLALAATVIVYIAWRVSSYSADAALPTALFLALFWMLFHAMGAIRLYRGSVSREALRRIFSLANVAIFYLALYTVVDPQAHAWMGAITLGFSAAYLATALIIQKKQPASEVSIMYFVVSAIALLAIATAIQFSGFTTAAIWSIEAAVLTWCGAHWKKRWVWLAALGLFALAAVKALATHGFFHLGPGEGYVVFLNARALALASLTVGFAAAAYIYGTLDHADSFLAKRSLQYGWIATLFLLLTLEISDYFFKMIGQGFGDQKISLALYRNMYLAAVWMLYSMPLLWFGLRRQAPPLFLSGIGAISLAVGLGGIWAMSYAPIERFAPFTNVRAALLALLIVGTVLHSQWLSGVRRRYHRLEALLHFTWGLLLFEFCTVETNDYFRKLMEFATDNVRAGLMFSRFMTFAAVWMVFSLPMVRLGLARKMKPTLYLGLWALLSSVAMAGVRGISFDPIEGYSFLNNYRVIIIAFVLAGCLVHANWIKYSGQLFGILYEILNTLRIATILLLLVLLTGETRDYFEKQIFLLQSGSAGAVLSDGVRALENMKQFALSTVWLLFSIALMGVGLWKRNRTFRLLAIGLFAATILKVFFYDLSFLDTLYRIFSFIGLGVILLAVSYLYQRYKTIILEETPFEQGKGKKDILL